LVLPGIILRNSPTRQIGKRVKAARIHKQARTRSVAQ
jgi:hypothetical protein